MNNENKLVPKFRFKEFEGNGECEEKALGEVFTSFSGGTPSTTFKKYIMEEIFLLFVLLK